MKWWLLSFFGAHHPYKPCLLNSYSHLFCIYHTLSYRVKSKMRHSSITLVTFLAIIFALGGGTRGQLMSNGLGQGELVTLRRRLLSHANSPSCRHWQFWRGCSIRRPWTGYKPVVCLWLSEKQSSSTNHFSILCRRRASVGSIISQFFFSRCFVWCTAGKLWKFSLVVSRVMYGVEVDILSLRTSLLLDIRHYCNLSE